MPTSSDGDDMVGGEIRGRVRAALVAGAHVTELGAVLVDGALATHALGVAGVTPGRGCGAGARWAA